MIFSGDDFLKNNKLPELFSIPSNMPQADVSLTHGYRGPVTPTVLLAYAIVANALFWSGLLTPFNANVRPEVVYLHYFLAALGFAMAFGGVLATLIIISRKGLASLLSIEFAAGFLNIFVLTATVAFVATALFSSV